MAACPILRARELTVMASKRKIPTADAPRRSFRNAGAKRRKIETKETKMSKSPRGAKTRHRGSKGA